MKIFRLFDRASLYLVFPCILLCPIRAVADCPDEAGDIPFIVTRKTNLPAGDRWLLVTGPGGRRSKVVEINSLALNVPCQFYAADDCSWCRSPYSGEWSIYFWKGYSWAPPFTPTRRFCFVEKVNIRYEVGSNSSGVYLNYDPNPGIHSECHLIRVKSDLAGHEAGSDSPEGGQPDIDIWQFAGTAGDKVTVKLEADTHGGNNEGEVTLAVSGGGVNTAKTGTLPLDLTVAIDATTTYNVTVE